jgi:hypothetical protein
LKVSYLFNVWNVLCVIGRMCEREKLIEFAWMCVTHEHNDMWKQKEHGKRLNIESRRNWNFIEYCRWSSLRTFYKNIYSSQIHHWICVKLQSTSKYKLKNVLSKF